MFIFPNPAGEYLIIRSDLQKGTAKIILTNLTSQTFVYHNDHNENLKLSLSNVPNGVYLVTLNGVGVGRIVIAR